VEALLRLVTRHGGIVLAASLALTALAASSFIDFRTGESRLRVDASADRLLPEGEPAREFYDHVRNVFGTDETLLVALRTGDVFHTPTLERIAALTARLERLDGVHHVLSLTNAVNVRGVDDDLEIAPFVGHGRLPESSEELADLREQVLGNPFYAGSLVSRDGRTTALVVYFADMSHQEYIDSGLDERIAEAVGAELGGVGDVAYWITGGPHIRAETAALFVREALTLPLAILAVMSVVLAFTFRTVRGVALPVGTIALAVCWTMGFVGLLGFQLNAVTSMVPPLLTTLALSYSVHVVAEYYDVLREGETDAPVHTALARVAMPVAITGLTTAVGFGALGLSPLGAVREFGLLSVLGIVCTVVASLTFTPACLALLGPPSRVPDGSPRRGPSFDRFAERVGRVVVAHRLAIFAGAAGVFALAVLGSTQLRVGTQQIQKFRPDAPVRVDFEAINEHLEGANVFSIVLETEVKGGLLEPADLAEIESLQSWLESQPEVGGTASLVDYIKLINRGFHGNDPAYFAIPEKRSTVRQLLVFGGGDELDRYVDGPYQTSNIQVRARVVDSDDVAALTARIEERLEELPRRLEANVTGTAIVFNRALDAIIRGQAMSMVVALAIIYGILAAMFLSLRVGVIALIPNALPVAVYFGALGWTGTRLDPGMSLVAPMVLGIAVDDTIHYFARFIRDSRRLGDEQRAAVSALKSVGRPVTVTTAALVLGFLVLNASELSTLASLGNMAAFALAFAWVTDFVLTPALCARLRIATLWDLLTIDLGRDPQRSIPLFSGLSARQARIVALLASMLDVPSGRRLFEAGEPGEALYVVIFGRLRARLHQDGRSVELATHERGGVCGEIGLFHQVRTADVDVLDDARLLRLDRDSIDQLGRRYPRIASVVFRNLNSTLAARMTRATQRERERLSDASSFEGAVSSVLETRGRALEDAFFLREAEVFRSELRRRSDTGAAGPVDAAGADGALVERLAGLGIGAETLTALTLIPLVEVAWADGHMDDRERDAILAGAEACGIAPESPGFGLLRLWLDHPPDPSLLDLWRSYIEAVCDALSVEARMRLRDAIVGRAREVGASAGGVMGIGAISRAEERVLGQLEQAFGT
jgi:predicted RND superfamily exporter protein/CRP-like cAMP-binding protein